MKSRQWYRVEMQADDPSAADIYVSGLIGDWIDDLFGVEGVTTAKSFIDALATLPAAVKTIRLHVNSPGGSVFDAVAIANALRDQRTAKNRRVESSIEGLAASAASIIVQAGDPIRMGDNALVMVHNPSTCGCGNAADLRKWADELDTIRNVIVATYKWHSALSDAELIALLDATTWMDADEAIAKGFATEKVAGLKAAATLDPKGAALLTVPAQYRARVDALIAREPTPTPTPAPVAAAAVEVLRRCGEAGLDLAFAQALVTAHLPLADVETRVTAEQETRARAATRAREITAICALAELPELSAGYIAGTMAPADVKTHVATITARMDKADIDANLVPGQGAARTPVLSTAEIYATRNQRPAKKE